MFFAHQKDLWKTVCLCCTAIYVYISVQFILNVHICSHVYNWLNTLFCNVAPEAALAVRQSSPLLLLSDFLKEERGTGVPAAGLPAWPALKRHHHQSKRALKCLLVLSSGFPFRVLWKPHSPQPDNSSRCLDGVQVAAYSLPSVRMAQSKRPCFHHLPPQTPPPPPSAFIHTPTPSFTHPLILPQRLFSPAWEIFVKAFF